MTTAPTVKQPGDSQVVPVSFASLLGAGVTVASIDGVEIVAKGKVAEVTALTNGAPSHDGTIAQIQFLGGTDGELYLITVDATLSNGDSVTREAEILVVDLTWFVPDANGGYATPDGMIARFGYDEVTLLTDLHNAGRIDAGALGAALADADAKINIYLQARYTLPLASTPQIITALAYEIARYLIHRDAVPDVVKSRHDAAIKTLERISTGEVQLGLDAAQQTTAQTGGPKVSAPTRIFTRDTLERF